MTVSDVSSDTVNKYNRLGKKDLLATELRDFFLHKYLFLGILRMVIREHQNVIIYCTVLNR